MLWQLKLGGWIYGQVVQFLSEHGSTYDGNWRLMEWKGVREVDQVENCAHQGDSADKQFFARSGCQKEWRSSGQH